MAPADDFQDKLRANQMYMDAEEKRVEEELGMEEMEMEMEMEEMRQEM